MAATRNACAGPFGALYDLYISRERIARELGRRLWGADVRVLYDSLRAELGDVADGLRVLDVPCGGGLALRYLRPGAEVQFVAADLDTAMLQRTRSRAEALGVAGVQTVRADMLDLPFEDESADLVLSYSGLHMVGDPRRAIGELARCVRGGGRLVGTSFVSDCSRRQRLVFAAGQRLGDAPLPCSSAELVEWLTVCGLADVQVTGRGFVAFSATKSG